MEYIDTNGICLCCGKRGVDLHHLKTRKSGGGDESWNLLPVCRRHHVEAHAIGLNIFAKKYSNVEAWLVKNNWYFSDFLKKWRHQ